MSKPLIATRVFEFETGTLHLERNAVTDAEALAYYEDAGQLLSVRDGEMPESQFYALPDFRDL